MTLSFVSDTDHDIEIALPAEALDASPEAQVWLLLCALTLTEVDPAIDDVRARDTAAALLASADYRELSADAAAYLWLSRTQAGVDGEQVV